VAEMPKFITMTTTKSNDYFTTQKPTQNFVKKVLSIAQSTKTTQDDKRNMKKIWQYFSRIGRERN